MSRLRASGSPQRRIANAAEFGHVAVLMGGASAEREVSLMTGNAVLEALLARRVDAAVFDPAERALTELVAAGFDRVFIALHGPGGEDGAVQGALEWLELPYWAGLWLGVFPTWQGVLTQAAAVVFVLGSYFAAEALRKQRRQARVATVAGAGETPRVSAEPEIRLPTADPVAEPVGTR